MTARSPCQQSGTLRDCTPSWHRGTSRACLAGVSTLCMIAHSPCWWRGTVHAHQTCRSTPCMAAHSLCQPCSTLHHCTPCRQRDTLHTHHAGRSTPCTIAHSLCQQSSTLHHCTPCWQRGTLHAVQLLAVGSPGGLGVPPCLMHPLGFALCSVLKAPAFWGGHPRVLPKMWALWGDVISAAVTISQGCVLLPCGWEVRAPQKRDV